MCEPYRIYKHHIELNWNESGLDVWNKTKKIPHKSYG